MLSLDMSLIEYFLVKNCPLDLIKKAFRNIKDVIFMLLVDWEIQEIKVGCGLLECLHLTYQEPWHAS